MGEGGTSRPAWPQSRPGKLRRERPMSCEAVQIHCPWRSVLLGVGARLCRLFLWLEHSATTALHGYLHLGSPGGSPLRLRATWVTWSPQSGQQPGLKGKNGESSECSQMGPPMWPNTDGTCHPHIQQGMEVRAKSASNSVPQGTSLLPVPQSNLIPLTSAREQLGMGVTLGTIRNC